MDLKTGEVDLETEEVDLESGQVGIDQGELLFFVLSALGKSFFRFTSSDRSLPPTKTIHTKKGPQAQHSRSSSSALSPMM